MQTVAHLTDDFIARLDLPQLPDSIPSRLEDAVRTRANRLLFELERAARERYAGAFEIRLLRDANRVVLTACELGLSDCETLYARFRALAEQLGYERCEVGYRKAD